MKARERRLLDEAPGLPAKARAELAGRLRESPSPSSFIPPRRPKSGRPHAGTSERDARAASAFVAAYAQALDAIADGPTLAAAAILIKGNPRRLASD